MPRNPAVCLHNPLSFRSNQSNIPKDTGWYSQRLTCLLDNPEQCWTILWTHSNLWLCSEITHRLAKIQECISTNVYFSSACSDKPVQSLLFSLWGRVSTCGVLEDFPCQGCNSCPEDCAVKNNVLKSLSFIKAFGQTSKNVIIHI